MPRELQLFLSHLLRLVGVLVLALCAVLTFIWVTDSQGRGLSLLPVWQLVTLVLGYAMFASGAYVAAHLPPARHGNDLPAAP